VTPGALADLVVARDDPSEDVSVLEDPARNVLAVMKDGAFCVNSLAPATHGAAAG
jgi:imidazolonepropionase-like amidohydrolase